MANQANATIPITFPASWERVAAAGAITTTGTGNKRRGRWERSVGLPLPTTGTGNISRFVGAGRLPAE